MKKKKMLNCFLPNRQNCFLFSLLFFFFFLQRTRLRSGSYIETKYYSNSVVVFFFCFTVCLKKYKYIILSVMNTHPFNGVENYFSIDVFFPFFFFLIETYRVDFYILNVYIIAFKLYG